MFVSLIDQLRRNYILRIFLLPIIRVKRRFESLAYKYSDNSEEIKKLREICKGERCFVIGNGPSLRGEDLDRLKDEKTFAFNRIYHIYESTEWRPTYYMVTDKSIIKQLLKEKIFDVESELAFVYSRKLYKKWNSKCMQIDLKGRTPIHKEKFVVEKLSESVDNFFSASQSVTINAIELAVYMGFKEIYLLGVDHNFAYEIDMNGNKVIKKNIEAHFREDKDKNIYMSCKEALTKCYETCKSFADEHDVQIINVTRGGCLEVFPRNNVDNILCEKR